MTTSDSTSHNQMAEISTTNSKLPVMSKVSYGLLDFAGNLIYNFGTTYILYFYTDVAGISLGVAGIILFLVRIVDAIDAPIWGIIVDKTKSRYGKCRPWFLWLPLPFCIFSALSFFTPDSSMTVKAVWAGIIYVLTSITYTGLNTPLSAILALLTPSPQERLKCNSYRMVGSVLGVLAMNATALPLVALMGGGNEIYGFFATATIFATISCLFHFFAFFNIKEIVTNASQDTSNVTVKDAFRALKTNNPWWIILVANLLFWVAHQGRGSAFVFYLSYSVPFKEHIAFINSIASVSVFFVMIIPLYCKFVSKTTVWIGGLILSSLGNIALFYSGDNYTLLCFSWILGNIGGSVACAMAFAMIPLAVDFGRWKSGKLVVGLLVSLGTTFCYKFGSGVGVAVGAWVMNFYGYLPGQVQPDSALKGIDIAVIWFPSVINMLAVIVLMFLYKYESEEKKYQQDIE
ncbi:MULTISPECIES: MFS transporter [unclassified Raoultella]|uniref:MFS transporter n=1 Tax=unclassified Raoultella TaxID=2627600 RepID=UPI001D0FD121|nr:MULTISPECIES: MFS transporter [unclassified Raoultella]